MRVRLRHHCLQAPHLRPEPRDLLVRHRQARLGGSQRGVVRARARRARRPSPPTSLPRASSRAPPPRRVPAAPPRIPPSRVSLWIPPRFSPPPRRLAPPSRDVPPLPSRRRVRRTVSPFSDASARVASSRSRRVAAWRDSAARASADHLRETRLRSRERRLSLLRATFRVVRAALRVRLARRTRVSCRRTRLDREPIARRVPTRIAPRRAASRSVSATSNAARSVLESESPRDSYRANDALASASRATAASCARRISLCAFISPARMSRTSANSPRVRRVLLGFRARAAPPPPPRALFSASAPSTADAFRATASSISALVFVNRSPPRRAPRPTRREASRWIPSPRRRARVRLRRARVRLRRARFRRPRRV